MSRWAVRRLNLTQWDGPRSPVPGPRVPCIPSIQEADRLTIYQRAVGRDLTHSLKLRAVVFLSSGWTYASYGAPQWYRADGRRLRKKTRRGGLAGECWRGTEAARQPREATCTQHTCTSGHSRVGSRLLKAARWMPLAALRLKRAFLPTSRLHLDGFSRVVSSGCAVKFRTKGGVIERESHTWGRDVGESKCWYFLLIIFTVGNVYYWMLTREGTREKKRQVRGRCVECDF